MSEGRARSQGAEIQGSGLAAGAAWTLAANLTPLLVAFWAIPVLTGSLAPERFAAVTIAWSVLGYFSIFDLGVGRALTKLVAERRAAAASAGSINGIIRTGSLLMLAVGVLGAGIAAVASGPIVRSLLDVSSDLQPELHRALIVTALAIPFVTLGAGFRGVLEAYGRFDLANLVRAPQGALTFLAPLAVVPFTQSVAAMVAALLVTRLLATLVQGVMVARLAAGVWRRARLERAATMELLRLGSWMTVSNVISPIMVTLDRFVIGSVASLTAVAFYTAPYEAITKLWLVPSALGAVLFPTFASSFARGDHAVLRATLGAGLRAVAALLLPVVLAVVLFAPELLEMWLGPVYARESAVVLRILAIGVFANCLAQVLFAFVQGGGRADLTAKAHLVEVVPYLLLLVFLIRAHGIAGAAAAWTLRAVADGGVLAVLSYRMLPERERVSLMAPTALVATALLFSVVAASTTYRLASAAVAVSMLPVLLWYVMLAPTERAWLMARVQRLRGTA